MKIQVSFMPTAAPPSSTFSQYTEKHLAFDICNVCNAQCYYCQTGFCNRNKIPCGKKEKFIEVSLFERVLRYLKAQGFVEADTKIHLYSWGEPMLHPEFAKIIEISKKGNCLVALSTNATALPKLPDTFDASNIGFVKISMCGFSQASYDKIHRFNFERIKETFVPFDNTVLSVNSISTFTFISSICTNCRRHMISPKH